MIPCGLRENRPKPSVIYDHFDITCSKPSILLHVIFENKLDQLRHLDANVTRKATIYSVTVGLIGALIMGSGMSLAMTDIGASLGLGSLPMIYR